MTKVKKKAVVGLTKRTSSQELLDVDEKKKKEVAPQEKPLALGEQIKGVVNVVAAYLGLALMLSVLWDALNITLYVEPKAAVWVTIFNNSTQSADEHVLEETPASLRVKLMSMYIAEDINATTLMPLYGARRLDVTPDTGAGKAGVVTALQRERRVWTHASCDPDGDGWIHDCDVSAGWKYRWQMGNFVDLALESPDPYTPQRHEVPAGEYRFVVLQQCLENLDNASLYAVIGGQMSELHTWRPPQPRHGGSCFVTARPLAAPLLLEHGDDVLITLAYDLAGTFRSVPTGDESPDEWECFDVVEGLTTASHCARMPSLQPGWIKRSEAANDTLIADDWFTVVQSVSNRVGRWTVEVPAPPPPPPPGVPPPSPPPPSPPPPPPAEPPSTPARRRVRRQRRR